jgi:hypothetical protein
MPVHLKLVGSRLAFQQNVILAVANKCQRHTVAHHLGLDIDTICPA